MIIKVKSFDVSLLQMNEQTISAIDNLMKAFGEKKHIVLAEPAFFEFIIKNNEIFGINSRAYANAALNQRRELHALTNIVSFYVEVDFSSVNLTDFQITEAGPDVLVISYDNFSDSELIQPASILCEDLNDTHLYEHLGNFFVQQKRLSSLNLNFKRVNGGGANTVKVFNELAKNGSFALCIIDSDKPHPNSARGSTSKKFGSIDHKNKCRLIILKAHEAESLIPTNLIDEIILKNSYQDSVIESYDKLKELINHNPDIKLYFDHKEGLSFKQIINLDKTYGPFWTPAIQSTNKYAHLSCIRSNICDDSCQCIKLEGFGDTLLDKGLTHFNQNKMSSIARTTSTQIINEWLYLGKLFFSWFCSPSPIKVRQ